MDRYTLKVCRSAYTSDPTVTGDAEKSLGIMAKLWIPSNAHELAHRGRDAMMTYIKRYFAVRHLRARVDRFFSACLMCKHVKGGKVIQPPLRPMYCTNERNDAMHFNFLSLGDSFSSDKYILILNMKQLILQRSHFVQIRPVPWWWKRCLLGTVGLGYHRFGSASKALIKKRALCTRFKARHEFTIAHSPWVNGSVERANRDIGQVLCVLCLEYMVDTLDWTFFMPISQSILNQTPVPSLGNRALLFCGWPLPSPLALCMDATQRKIMEIPTQPDVIGTWLEELRNSIRNLHQPITEERERQAVLNQRNQKRAHRPNFDVGYYLLRSRVDQNRHDKLLVTWVGSYPLCEQTLILSLYSIC
ncbi:Hypothetical protein PHPALM_177 [Phytophthora palmivora]|uniref:Integrase zinc-binding domain-containing protein n=1 Tax=Phytophthora palmivora TaxID=4796 RepID=A0A2P4YVH5_9STRA|nr:Hypothetical protein PHPALM_177 [Phytophthora palmivora]